MAPETLTNNKHGPSGDVWSLGVVYWELLTLARASPYGNTDLQGIFAFLKAGKRLSLPEECNSSVKQ